MYVEGALVTEQSPVQNGFEIRTTEVTPETTSDNS